MWSVGRHLLHPTFLAGAMASSSGALFSGAAPASAGFDPTRVSDAVALRAACAPAPASQPSPALQPAPASPAPASRAPVLLPAQAGAAVSVAGAAVSVASAAVSVASAAVSVASAAVSVASAAAVGPVGPAAGQKRLRGVGSVQESDSPAATGSGERKRKPRVGDSGGTLKQAELPIAAWASLRGPLGAWGCRPGRRLSLTWRLSTRPLVCWCSCSRRGDRAGVRGDTGCRRCGLRFRERPTCL